MCGLRTTAMESHEILVTYWPKLWTKTDHLNMEVADDSHEQMEGSCTEDLCVGQSFLTPITGQSFLTSRFGDASNLSPMDPW